MSLTDLGRPRVMRAGTMMINPSSPEALGGVGDIWGYAQSAVYSVGSKCVFVPFTIDQIVTAYQMYTSNGTVAANAIDVGIYDAHMNSLVTLGGTNQVGTSDLQLFDITDTILVPGRYFMGMSMNGSPPTGTIGRWNATARNLRLVGCLEKLSTYPLPTGAVTTTTVSDAQLPHFGVVLQTTA